MNSHQKLPQQYPLKPRKKPVQSRSTVTVEAVFEATIQVLLAEGLDRLTTTRVAERAGVSVGTLYQYYPNKHSLLFAVLERHLTRVAVAIERICKEYQYQPLEIMIEALVRAFIDVKMERTDISKALYFASSELGGPTLVRKILKRGRTALASVLVTAPQVRFKDVEFTAFMLFSAMAGATRAVLEAGASPQMVRQLREELLVLCQAYVAQARIGGK